MAAAVSAPCVLRSSCTQKPRGCIILMLARSYYALFLSRALLLQVECPVNVAAQLPALSPAGREQGQSRLSLWEWMDVPREPQLQGCPHSRPEDCRQHVAPGTSINQATPAKFLLRNTFNYLVQLPGKLEPPEAFKWSSVH